MSTITGAGSEKRNRPDRRTANIDFDRRCYDRRDRSFVFEKTVYLSDTNAFGNTYFAKYIEWQGAAREAFLKRCLVKDFRSLVMSGIKLITVKVNHEYKKETVVYDRVLIKVRVGAPKRMSVELQFTFLEKGTDKLIGRGRQIIAFANAQGKLIRVPEEIATNVRKFRREGI